MCTYLAYSATKQEERQMPTPTIPTESLKFTEARPKLSSLLDRVFRRQVRIRLYKGSTPVAAIVSIGDLERLEQFDRQREADFKEMTKIGEYFLDVSDEELQMRIDEAVAQVRAENRAKRQAAAQS
jgi:prevent-host-death family protein